MTRDIYDGLGSVVGMTDSTGTAVKNLSYDPYGQETSNTGPKPTYFTDAGGYWAHGNVLHFGQRWYDPATGRWTQQDPLDQTGDLQGGDPYAYVGDDPVSATDPSGLAANVLPPKCQAHPTASGCQAGPRQRGTRLPLGEAWRRLTTPSKAEQEGKFNPCHIWEGCVPHDPDSSPDEWRRFLRGITEPRG